MATAPAAPVPSKLDQRIAREAAREAVREVQEAAPSPADLAIEGRPTKFQRRIDRLVKDRSAAEARAQSAEAKVAQLTRLLNQSLDQLRIYHTAFVKLGATKEARHHGSR